MDQHFSGRPRRIVVAGLKPHERRPVAPKRPKKPLFFYDRRGVGMVNLHHWAAPLIILLKIVTLPLAIAYRVLRRLYRKGRMVWWRIAENKRHRTEGAGKS